MLPVIADRPVPVDVSTPPIVASAVAYTDPWTRSFSCRFDTVPICTSPVTSASCFAVKVPETSHVESSVVAPVTLSVAPTVAAVETASELSVAAPELVMVTEESDVRPETSEVTEILSPDTSMFEPAVSWPAPENCSKCRLFADAPWIVSVRVPLSAISTKPWFVCTLPLVTNTNEPARISPVGSSLKFAARRSSQPSPAPPAECR